MRRSLFLLLILSTFVFVHAEEVTIDGLTYSYDKGTMTASVFEGDVTYTSFVIPEKINVDDVEYTVTSIGVGAFVECVSLTSVSVPNTITEIEDYAFQSYIVYPNRVL